VPLISRYAVYPPELNLSERTILNPESSLNVSRHRNSHHPQNFLLTRLIEKGRVLDWKHLGIGYALDYSRILNRQLDIELCDSLASDQIQSLINEKINCILAPDSSAGPIAAFLRNEVQRGNQHKSVFVRLNKGNESHYGSTHRVQLASYTRTEGSKPLLSTITAEVGDFPTVNLSCRTHRRYV